MSLIKWKSNELFPKFDTLWDDFFNKDFFSKGIELGTTIPAVNFSESETAYLLEMAIPGLKKEDFKIDLHDYILTVSSEKKEEKEDNDGNEFSRKEFSYSSFKRSFQLPENVNSDHVEAEYTDGLLKLTLPKKEVILTNNKKQIEVK